ncbi:MAG: GTPase domain-containing protein [Deltaproteobacteria bacterium]|nr:GTPase domain-containing protein [Deltaproteobacteria bacterium]
MKEQAGRVLALLTAYETHPAVAGAVERLEETLALVTDRERPTIVALVGGTGVGKSALFNAIVGGGEVSRVSGDVRPCTRRPHLARAPRDAALLAGLGLEPVEETSWPQEGLALVDTPDLDSLELANREVARQAIALADIVVYVTDPDKVSNLDLLTEVRDWSEKKRWLFVMNKADTLPGAAERQAAHGQLTRRLAEVGFPARESSVFLVSAMDPADPGVSRLAGLILERTWRGGLRQIMADDALLGALARAADPRFLEEIRTARAGLEDILLELHAELSRLVGQVLDRADLYPALAPILRRHLVGRLPQEARGPLTLPLALHARLAGISSAWQVWRMLSRGVSLTRLFKFGFSFWSVFQGTYDLKRLVEHLAQRSRGGFEDLERRAMMSLEDQGFFLAAGQEAVREDPWREVWEELRGVPLVGGSLANLTQKLRALQRLEDRNQAMLFEVLSQALEEAGREMGQGLVRWYDELLALLPLPFLGHVAYILGQRWWQESWLGFNFYLHAGFLFLLLWLPAYGLVMFKTGRRVKNQRIREQVAAAAALVPPTGPLEPLSAAVAGLEEGAQLLEDLGKEARALRANQARQTRLGILETASPGPGGQGDEEPPATE